MTTISENLQELKDTKERLKTALENKGQDLTNVPFTQYPEKVSAIESGPEIDLSQTTATEEDVLQGKQFYNAQGELVVGGYKDMLNRQIQVTKSCAKLFYGFPDEDMSWIKNLDTSPATTMNNMFVNCKNVVELDLSSFNTSNVNQMDNVFNNSTKLKKLNLSSFDTRNVTDISSMFYGCSELEELDLSSFDTSNATRISSMFSGCSKLKRILGTLNANKSVSMSDIFKKCYLLETVTLKNIRVSLPLNNSYSLTNETLINIFKELHDLTGGTSQTLTLHSTSKTNIANIYVKLIDVTDEMRAEDEYIDNKKPCVVCESTDAGAMTLTEYAISKNWAIA